MVFLAPRPGPQAIEEHMEIQYISLTSDLVKKDCFESPKLSYQAGKIPHILGNLYLKLNKDHIFIFSWSSES